MAEKSVARERRERTTRHHRADHEFVALLEEDFGIPRFSLEAAFIGVPSVPKKQAIKVCEWAERRTDDPDRCGAMIRAWARKRRVGGYDRRLTDAPELTFEQTARERAAAEGRA